MKNYVNAFKIILRELLYYMAMVVISFVIFNLLLLGVERLIYNIDLGRDLIWLQLVITFMLSIMLAEAGAKKASERFKP